MSFRIKASHGFLKAAQAPPTAPKERSLDDLLDEEKKSNSYEWDKYKSHGKPAVYVPASNAHIDQTKGFVVRPNFRAQEDYM